MNCTGIKTWLLRRLPVFSCVWLLQLNSAESCLNTIKNKTHLQLNVLTLSSNNELLAYAYTALDLCSKQVIDSKYNIQEARIFICNKNKCELIFSKKKMNLA